MITVPAVLLGLKTFGMIGAIGGHAIAESAIRVAMLDRVRRELDAPWREVLPWRQLAVIALASAVACAAAAAIARLAAEGPRPFLALCAAGALYVATYLLVIALMRARRGGVSLEGESARRRGCV